MIITFANNTSFEYLDAVATEEFYNGSSRRTLTFECMPGVISIDKLNALLSNEANTQTIILIGDKSEEGVPAMNIYDGFVLKLEVGIKPKLVQEETPEKPAVYADRLIFKLGTRTFIEEQLHKMGLQ